MQFLVEQGACLESDITKLLFRAVLHNNIDMVTWLLTCPAVDLRATEYGKGYGKTLLHRAAGFGFLEIVKLLLAKVPIKIKSARV